MVQFKYVASALLIVVVLAGGAYLMATTETANANDRPAQPEATVSASASVDNPITADYFLSLIRLSDANQAALVLAEVEKHWQEGFIPMMLEAMLYTNSGVVVDEIRKSLIKMTGQKLGRDIHQWNSWMWNRPEVIDADYARFKAELYRYIDPRFEKYFRDRQALARIRLDEIQWGGVSQDGIPPLRNPKMISAAKATYLDDDNIVFGIEINGDARAYPKRILAWHEMFTDTVGGVDVAGVYCTLCGTVIPYKTRLNGVSYKLGTSGFLYRSNKLMYDADTQSLWNTIRGEPVVGPLVDKGIALEFLSVVTTTWGEWRRRHPETTVLSLETGHQRNYGEGVAYSDYFADDELMFRTPFDDKRLNNKQEVLALRFMASPSDQLAIDTDFLKANPLYADRVGQQRLVVLTDKSGANRVYDPQGIRFTHYDQDRSVTDEQGTVWTLAESSLVAPDGRTLSRLPYHRAFWFGWHATFPDTRLVK